MPDAMAGCATDAASHDPTDRNLDKKFQISGQE